MQLPSLTLKKTKQTTIIIFISGLLITLLYAGEVRKNKIESDKLEFSIISFELKSKILARLEAHAQILRSGASFMRTAEPVSRNKWKDFINDSKVINSLPGIQGIGLSVVIPKNNLNEHIQNIRREGFPDYKLKPPGERDFYSAIIYLEPFNDRNQRAFGYDMFSEPTRRKAMEQARDYDMVSLSGRVILLQETDKDVQAGTLMYTPYYRKGMPTNTIEERRAALLGWVYSPYRMVDLMEGILGDINANTAERMRLEVFDEDSLTEKAILYDSNHLKKENFNSTKKIEIIDTIHFNKKLWTIRFTRIKNDSIFLALSDFMIIFIFGSIISLLLAALTFALLNTKIKAVEIAEHMTKALKESEQWFQVLLDSTAEAIYGQDLNGNCSFCNNSFVKILRYENQNQLLGKNMHDLLNHSDKNGNYIPNKECKIHQSIINLTAMHSDEEYFTRADNTSFPVEYWSHPFYINGKIIGSVVSFLDITERKKLTNDLIDRTKQAEAANIAKSEFLAVMSHEIRTPLNGVIGFTDLLMKSNLDESQSKFMSAVYQSATSLLDLINDILDFSKIEAGRLELNIEKIDLFELVGQAIDSTKIKSHEKNIEILLNILPTLPRFIWADSVRLRQILINLLSNAMKFTNEGEVELKIELVDKLADTNENVFLFSIRDTGIGIAPENQKKIFEAFSQEDYSTTRKYGGTGLGLTISNKLLKLMQSFLELKSQIGVGSIFSFKLKVKTEAGNVLVPEPMPPSLKILIVDDNENNRNILHEMLRLNSIQNDTVSSGIDAIDKIKENKYDIIIMDYHMPKLDGIQTISKIRKELGITKKDLSIILLYSSAEDNFIHNVAKDLDIQVLITKPIKIISLYESLQKVLTPVTINSNDLPKNTETRSAKIFIVDDDSINRVFLKSIIKKKFPQVTCIELKNGKEAVEEFQKTIPDIILMDNKMPIMDGYEASIKIRKLKKDGHHIPIIVIIDGITPDVKVKYINAGMDEYITRPILKNNLEKVIEKWLTQIKI